MGKYIELTNENFDTTVNEGVSLVDFWAPWCGPCRMLAPVIDKVADAIGDEATVAKCNTDDAGTSAQIYNVSSIPTLLIFKEGVVVETLVGAAQKEADLVSKIKAHK